MKERLHTGRKFSAVSLVIVQVILVLPWILIDGKYYNTYMVFCSVCFPRAISRAL